MINSYDLETYNNNQNIYTYCACMIIDNHEYSFYGSDCITQSINYIFDKIEDSILIYVHNLNYDSRLILDVLSESSKYVYDSIISDGIIYGLFIYNKKKKIEFRCSYRLLPVSLKKIAIDFNLNLRKMPYPYNAINSNTIEKNMHIYNSEYFESNDDYNIYCQLAEKYNNLELYTIEYCMNDVRITVEFVKLLRNIVLKYKIDILKKKIYSISSLSISIFTKCYNIHNLKTKMNRISDDYIRAAYYGGRCEVFGNKYDDETLYHFDFSGMYGQCMQEKLPNGKISYISKPKNIDKPGFYDIIYESFDMQIPILPHHSKKNGKLLFVNGRNRGKFWFEEIKLFVDNGGIIIEILSAIIYEKYEYIFLDFVSEFNKYRQIGKSYKTFGKLIINSLYGRFGMNIKNDKTIILNKSNIDNIESKYNIKSISQHNNIYFVEIETDDLIPKYSNIGISAAIASKARIKLYKAIKDTTNNEGRVLYSDTDSIFAAFKKNVDDHIQGEVIWRKEEKIDDAIFISPKEYALKYKNHEIIKIKGISKNIKIEYNKLKKLFYENKKLTVYNNIQYNRNIKISYKNIDKIIDLSKYDKRIFIKMKKETIAHIENNAD